MDFPIKNGGSFHSFLYVYPGRVSLGDPRAPRALLQARAAIESKDHGALADLMDQNFNLRRSARTWGQPWGNHGDRQGKPWGNGYYAGNHGKWIDYGGYEMVILDGG